MLFCVGETLQCIRTVLDSSEGVTVWKLVCAQLWWDSLHLYHNIQSVNAQRGQSCPETSPPPVHIQRPALKSRCQNQLRIIKVHGNRFIFCCTTRLLFWCRLTETSPRVLVNHQNQNPALRSPTVSFCERFCLVVTAVFSDSNTTHRY